MLADLLYLWLHKFGGSALGVRYSSVRMGSSWAVVLSDGVAMWDTNEPRDEDSTVQLEEDL